MDVRGQTIYSVDLSSRNYTFSPLNNTDTSKYVCEIEREDRGNEKGRKMEGTQDIEGDEGGKTTERGERGGHSKRSGRYFSSIGYFVLSFCFLVILLYFFFLTLLSVDHFLVDLVTTVTYLTTSTLLLEDPAIRSIACVQPLKTTLISS